MNTYTVGIRVVLNFEMNIQADTPDLAREKADRKMNQWLARKGIEQHEDAALRETEVVDEENE